MERARGGKELGFHGMSFCTFFLKFAILFFFFNIYLFIIWLHWVLVVAVGLLSCGSPAPQLWHANS